MKSILTVATALGAAALLAAAVSATATQQEPTLRREAGALVRTGVPGVVVLAKTPGSTTRVAAGIDRAAPRRPMLASDRFRIGSITKTFVSALVLRLVEDGRVSLDDTVGHWLPSLVPNGDTVTVRQLLQHTSGLFDYAADPATFMPFATDPGHAWLPHELVAIANGHAPSFAPGQGWGYSNTNYVLLGLIVEKVAGTPVGTQLAGRIFRPLGLWATTFDTDGRFSSRSAEGRSSRLAHGYSVLERQTFDASDLNPSWSYAAGAITSTADDVATFYSALMSGKLVRTEALEAMKAALPLSPTRGYGLGLSRSKTSCGWFWGHDGGTFGYTSNVLVSGNGKRVAVVLVNRGPLTAPQHAAFDRLATHAACGKRS